MSNLARFFTPDDWKRGVALVILWSYAYQLVAWPPLWWIAAFINTRGITVPLPPLLPWELLGSGTLTLASIGGIQAVRDKWTPPPG